MRIKLYLTPTTNSMKTLFEILPGINAVIFFAAFFIVLSFFRKYLIPAASIFTLSTIVLIFLGFIVFSDIGQRAYGNDLFFKEGIMPLEKQFCITGFFGFFCAAMLNVINVFGVWIDRRTPKKNSRCDEDSLSD